jgi:hypothetical protein
MMSLLVLKERLITIYQRIEVYAKPIIRFFITLLVFMVINSSIGYDARFKSIPVLLFIALICAFLPTPIMILLAAMVSFFHVYFVSKILSVIVLLVFLILYLLFARFTPRYGYVLVLLPILFLLKIPYVVPILLGLIATPVTIIPVSCGVFLFYFIQVIKQAALITVSVSVEDTLQLYTFVIDSLKANKQMLLTLVIFALVIIVTYVIRTKKIDYAFDIAIVTGVVTNILLFLIGDLKLDISDQILSLVLGAIASGLIVYIIKFFKLTLDYTAVEYVQFEDDDYYYYVKAVPKMKVSAPQRNVKRINVKKVNGDTANVRDTIRNEMMDDEDSLDFEDYDTFPDEDKK